MTTFAETEKIELKQKFTESIPKEIVAFLNTDGGTVYIGVDDNGVVCGVKDLDETLKKVADVIENQILPDPRPFVELGTKFVEQKHVVEIKVFREAWFNACLHNNWVDGTPPAIYIYTNRMEIISTGGLPANLTKEDFFRGVSKPVNEELAKLFIRLDLMEQTGYGVPRVTQSYGQEAFEFLDFFIRVTVPFAFEIEFEEVNQQGNEPVNSKNGETAQKNGEKVTENVTETGKVTEKVTEKVIEKVIEKAALSNEKLSDNQMAILRMIIHNPFVSKAGLAESVGISLNSVSRNIEALRGKYLHRVGPAKGGYWEILQGSEPINPSDGETVEKTVEKTGKTVGKTVGKTGKTVEKTAEKLVGIIKVNSKVTIKELTSLLNITRRGVEEQIKSLKDKGIIRRVGPAKGGHWELLQQS